LLQAAQSSFASHGFEAASLRQIASTAGLDAALVIHRFGSKDALWNAVIERQALYLAPFLAQFEELQAQTDTPIQLRLETVFRQLVIMIIGEPECGMLIARISSERGDKLKVLTDKLLRPTRDALHPLFAEAAQANVIKKQPLELLNFMLLNAVIMSASCWNILGYLDTSSRNQKNAQEKMAQFLIVNFIEKPLSGVPSASASTNRKKRGPTVE
jgi:AcrR family transcriptional regulator